MENLLNTDSLIEFHEKLNEFANHHQNLGGQKAHKLIKQMWDENKNKLRDGSNEGILRDEGSDRAFKEILGLLRKEFIP